MSSLYGFFNKIVLDAGTKFVSEKIKTQQVDSAYSTQYHHYIIIKAMEQVETCIKISKEL